jgi:putative membrane protein
MSENSAHRPSETEMLDPDVRFLLANERTLLAWIRTALAVVAGGVALTQIGGDSKTKSVIGVAAISLGGFMAVVGYIRYQAADKAIRRGELPTIGNEPIIQVASVAIIALALVVSHIFGVW